MIGNKNRQPLFLFKKLFINSLVHCQANFDGSWSSKRSFVWPKKAAL
ncbi:hypothetical protein BGP_6639 [Beggiatoa sp. PS]|nr:hypothetical protein BGP_6639 [Beggiatoa sp. PS]